MSKKDRYKPLEAWRIITNPSKGITPAIICCNTKYSRNIGMITRLASCYDVKQVWFTGNRVAEDIEQHGRIPREERFKGYEDVELIWHERPLDFFPNATPVAIEVKENAEQLHQFEHPQNPIYIFGQEDGSLPRWVLHHCHRFVVIPTKHCLNISTAVSTILWDRQYKEYLNGKDITDFVTPGTFEKRGYE
jgi:tRNA(Leu) C34 or U34 (ribose-2'-O)-methylase TrmL